MKIRPFLALSLLICSFSALAQMPRASFVLETEYEGKGRINSSTPEGKARILEVLSSDPSARALMNAQRASLATEQYNRAVANLRSLVSQEIAKTKYFKLNTNEIRLLTDLRLETKMFPAFLVSQEEMKKTFFIAPKFLTGLKGVTSYGTSVTSASLFHAQFLQEVDNFRVNIFSYIHSRENALAEQDAVRKFRNSNLTEFSELNVNDSDRGLLKDSETPGSRPASSGAQVLDA